MPLVVPLKVVAIVPPPLHIFWFDEPATSGVGLTVIVKLVDAPVQPPTDGVTVTVAVAIAVPVFIAVKEAMLPVPLDARPILLLSLVHVYVAVTLPVKLTAVVDELLHIAWLAIAATFGVGFTVMVKSCADPAQLPDAVTVIVATTTALVVLVAVNAAMFPLPDAARPIDVLLFVQLNGAPVPVKLMAEVVPLLHKAWLPGLLTVPPGLTVIVNVETGPKQLLACGVTVNTPLIGDAPALVAVNDAIAAPEPLAPIPIPVLLLTHVKVVPATLLPKDSVLVFALLHTLCDVCDTDIIGVGLTVIVNV